jgi:hypothetical protein
MPSIERSSVRRAVALAIVAALAVASAALAAAPPILGPESLAPGTRAIVRTVFRGDSVEEFQADIVGVLSGGRTEGQTIVARAVSERLRQTGVAQGMSGSPVYVDGRLIGALSSSWPFEREPLFGITPIGEMLAVLDHPPGPVAGTSAGPSGVDLAGPPGGARFAQFHWDPDGPESIETGPTHGMPEPPGEGEGEDPGDENAALRPAAVPAALPIPLSCAGFAPAGLAAAARALGPLGFRVVPGGSAADGRPDAASLGPGSAVAVDLMRGDLQVSAIGTVTWRDGDRVLLFGHPFFQSGGVLLPMSTARITTVVSSDYVSFKLGVRGREIGTVTQDRRAAVSGSIGPRAGMLPLAVRIERQGVAVQSFRFEMVEDRTLAPQLAGVAALNSVLESGGTGANQTLAWTLTLHRRGRAPLVLSDFASGEAPTSETAAAITGPLAFLFGNPYQRLDLDSLTVAIRVAPGRALHLLRSARLLDAAVRPGGVARLECQLEPWRGVTRTVRLEVPVPEEVPDGRYVLWVGGGPELSRLEAARLPARFRPVSLDDAWERLGRLRSSGALYAVILAGAPDVTAAGQDYPELPGSAAAMLSSGLTTGDLARRGDAALVGETRLPIQGATRGELQLALVVDAKAP